VINGLQQHVFENWVERCKKCISCQGRYFEKETVNAPPQINKVSPRTLQTTLEVRTNVDYTHRTNGYTNSATSRNIGRRSTSWHSDTRHLAGRTRVPVTCQQHGDSPLPAVIPGARGKQTFQKQKEFGNMDGMFQKWKQSQK
jgi:hypothetical protein